ncbi:patatin-like phospholipase family protein [Variovorax sp. YR216]|uniref:patatin-like phospholipase family protein n=1 Tax=Variovorax sp. YR216 TaxID=1882828 RepID=UPI00089B5967|nr:patatin-like phospholipase family protein [Variovorax sp. YR216]SEA56887.1 NTE family protein [Variovorax sp. YR216]
MATKKKSSSSASTAASVRPGSSFDFATVKKALVLQGGGALGAYQAGVYAGVFERHKTLDWVAGVSIGAINAALIAGNAPEMRVQRLREFWDLVSSGPAQRMPAWWAIDRSSFNQWSATSAAVLGVPGFFEPRRSPSLLLGGAAPLLSYYDTAPLKSTLERLVDFDRINHDGVRFSVGAVNVRTGNSIYFDNRTQRIGPEHIMASGALPPGFAPVHIDGEDYWDGGIVSNTPLQYVLDAHPRSEPLMVLQVDLFSARGGMPRTIGETMERQKDITYSSRTRMNTDAMASNMNLEQALVDLLDKLPPTLRKDPSVISLCAALSHKPIEIVHLIYRDKPYELESKDYEFSRASVDEHWDAGLRDIRNTLDHPDWLVSASQTNGVTTFDLTEPNARRVRRPLKLPEIPAAE